MSDFESAVATYETTALKIRRDIINLVHNVHGGGHIGPSLSIVDILAVLYKEIIRPKDHFILSKEHGALCWYAAMYETGLLAKEHLEQFEQNGGVLPGHGKIIRFRTEGVIS
ncbi:hypothetical protein FACS1894187_01950 [Synergistales bacterium]|nr:hypothetical protein FACS1894187_01950 [Synergistales bacterium]